MGRVSLAWDVKTETFKRFQLMFKTYVYMNLFERVLAVFVNAFIDTIV